MIFLVGSKIDRANIHASLGKPEYSYYFLLREFLPALERLGRVVVVDSVQQIDALFDQYRAEGCKVVFLSFSPPHQTPLGLRCPTIPVFAWEFDSLPNVAWGGDQRQDWRYVFRQVPGAIATSSSAAALVRGELGGNYPVISLPAPTRERFAGVCPDEGELPPLSRRQIRLSGVVFDSLVLGFSADGLVRNEPAPPEVIETAVPASEGLAAVNPGSSSRQPGKVATLWRLTARMAREWWREIRQPRGVIGQPDVAQPASVAWPEAVIDLSGVVYTTILSPADKRKNWLDLISAFCWTFKDVEDATLVVKMVHHDLEHYRIVMMTLLSRLAPFRCRVVVLHGYLDDAEYLNLIKSSTFYVNASKGEGLCIPLTEFLSCGKPAIAPKHTAMADYLDADMAFLLKHSIEPCCWNHDPTGMLLSHFHRVSWQSLAEAYAVSYDVAKNSPSRYQDMSGHAAASMTAHCSAQRVSDDLGRFLEKVISRNPLDIAVASL